MSLWTEKRREGEEGLLIVELELPEFLKLNELDNSLIDVDNFLYLAKPFVSPNISECFRTKLINFLLGTCIHVVLQPRHLTS
jgi:hypothetical protein